MSTIKLKNPPVRPKPVKLVCRKTGKIAYHQSVRQAATALGVSPVQVRRATEHEDRTVKGHQAVMVPAFNFPKTETMFIVQ